MGPSSTSFPASSHLRPRRSGSVIDIVGSGAAHSVETASSALSLTYTSTLTSIYSCSTTSTSTSTSSVSAHATTTSTNQVCHGDFLMAYDADEEAQDEDDLANQDSDLDSEDTEDSEAWHYNNQHQHQHHPHSHPHPHPHYQHQQQNIPLYQSAQPVSLDDLDDYISDDPDSDDAGAPLVNYMDVVNLIANGMDSEHELAPGGDASSDVNSNVDVGHSESGEHHEEGGDDGGNHDPPPPYPYMNPSMNPDLLSILSESTSLASASNTLQMLAAPQEYPAPEMDIAAVSEWLETAHASAALANPNPFFLGPGNYCLTDFLQQWARQSRHNNGKRGRFPWPNKINELSSKEVRRIKYADLHGDLCDMQGIDWADLGVTRKEARERRLNTYKNYVCAEGADRWTPELPDIAIPRSESYFRFRRMDIRQGINLAHFQLRNVLATTSRTRAFYPGHGVVHQFNPISTQGRIVMELGDSPGHQVSTMTAGHGVLVAGIFNGEYVLRHIDSNEPRATACHEGVITPGHGGITNHVQVHLSRRSCSPQAAFATNDKIFRVLDIASETWLSNEKYDVPLNCTAISPDKRLRVVVGDDNKVLIVAAESTLAGGRPEILQALSGHRDHAFACDWSDDGWSVATGSQDMSVKIWDARRWTDSSGNALPVCTLRAEMAGVRNLKFSPAGSGKRVLVAAEEADFINIIDAQTYRSRQTIDLFGELAGVSFTNDGQELMVLCCDRTRGGLIQLERCGFNDEPSRQINEGLLPRGQSRRPGYDGQMSSPTYQRLRERRKAAAADMLNPF